MNIMENLTSVTFNVPSATHLNTGKLKTNVLRVKRKFTILVIRQISADLDSHSPVP